MLTLHTMRGIGITFIISISSVLQAQQDSLVLKPDSHLVTKDTVIASFYAKKFEGRRCASGEPFRHNKLTAAHKTLAFGTWVKVTNLSNDSVVLVKINDRLPPKSKRGIDLTLAAAKQLNFVRNGLTRVTLEIVPPPIIEEDKEKKQ